MLARLRVLTPTALLPFFCALGLIALAAPAALVRQPPKPRRIDFDRDIRPILSDNCFACHGNDASSRQAGLRLDLAEGALGQLPTGHRAVVPGNADESMLVVRTAAAGPMRMPPVDSGKTLTPAQIATLRAWVEQGGVYTAHWAFVAPRRPPVPDGPPAGAADGLRGLWTSWPVNPIDRFVLARLRREGLKPSAVADRPTLIRRVSLDLTGLPPTPEEVDAFLADRRPGAYERIVDRLLASPHYGERMALKWLDLSRYADTHGYHIDSQRDMWRWRDWVIGAFNRNLPYDRFVVQQIAGDLLPGATLDQRIATGFNRNHPINFEGGAIPEEYAAAYVFDRVDTTATAFLGLTVRCAQCHDHKYDPISQREYYRFFAYFNTVDEQGLDGQKGNAAPFIRAPLPGQQELLDACDRKLAELDSALKARAQAAAAALAGWERTAALDLARAPATAAGLVAYLALDEGQGDATRNAAPQAADARVEGKADWQDGRSGKALAFDGSTYLRVGARPAFDRADAFSMGAWVNPASTEHMAVLSRMDDSAAFRGWDLYLGDGKVYVHLIHQWEKNAIRVMSKDSVKPGKWTHVLATYDGSGKAAGVKVYLDGKPAAVEVTHDTLAGAILVDKPLLIGRRNPAAPFKGRIDEVRVYARALAPAEVERLVGSDAVRDILAAPPDKRTPEQREELARFYFETEDEPYRELLGEQAQWRAKRAEADAAIPTTMVMREMEKPRATHVLERGQYDRPGETVTPGTPACLPPLPAGAPPNRLSLARWLVSPRNPLTARVAVNRFWEMCFGTGLVKTSEDFGTQGEAPSHPELLDWLATELERTGWDVKRMERLIVTSATYRQRSSVSPELLRRDPENRLLARGPRFRLAAEIVRDQALAVSGLLVPAIGGPSVKPYQPAGLWEEMAFGQGFSAQRYEQDHGDKLYRRSLYTFWKRTVPPPSLQVFDAPEREYCVVRRLVTNTPLQALVLMNDPTYVEAARRMAERALAAAPADEARLIYAFRLATARPPRPAEAAVLLRVLRAARARYAADAAAARKLLAVGESPRNTRIAPAELAAWTSVSSVILNLDETVTKG
ncbi:MAG: DUF1553 domain-containing protein [Chthonomonadales bacterium]|nr:DUF1553 domain-containing protein [Chthonomonadales bacterium]